MIGGLLFFKRPEALELSSETVDCQRSNFNFKKLTLTFQLSVKYQLRVSLKIWCIVFMIVDCHNERFVRFSSGRKKMNKGEVCIQYFLKILFLIKSHFSILTISSGKENF